MGLVCLDRDGCFGEEAGRSAERFLNLDRSDLVAGLAIECLALIDGRMSFIYLPVLGCRDEVMRDV
jgi:hypothetical protein